MLFSWHACSCDAEIDHGVLWKEGELSHSHLCLLPPSTSFAKATAPSHMCVLLMVIMWSVLHCLRVSHKFSNLELFPGDVRVRKRYFK